MNIMLDFHQKRKVRAVLYNHITLAFLFVLVLLALHSTWKVYQKKRESEEMKNISIAQVETLRERDEELKMKINRIETISGVEEEIRSKFNVVKDKENVVMVLEDEDLKASTTSLKTGFWASFRAFFTR